MSRIRGTIAQLHDPTSSSASFSKSTRSSPSLVNGCSFRPDRPVPLYAMVNPRRLPFQFPMPLLPVDLPPEQYGPIVRFSACGEHGQVFWRHFVHLFACTLLDFMVPLLIDRTLFPSPRRHGELSAPFPHGWKGCLSPFLTLRARVEKPILPRSILFLSIFRPAPVPILTRRAGDFSSALPPAPFTTPSLKFPGGLFLALGGVTVLVCRYKIAVVLSRVFPRLLARPPYKLRLR